MVGELVILVTDVDQVTIVSYLYLFCEKDLVL